MGIIDRCANELSRLAEEARRLPPPCRKNPEAFHEARSELAREMERLAQRLLGDVAIGRPPRAPIRPGTIRSRTGAVIPVEVRNRRLVKS